jgi:hypothetical protein
MLGRLVQSKYLTRNADAVLAAIASRTEEALQAEVRANAAKGAPDKTVVKELQERVRERAAALGIEPEILATRRDLAAVALGSPPPHIASGWRSVELARALETGPVTAAPAPLQDALLQTDG